jgi:L-fucose isomerase-like protein
MSILGQAGIPAACEADIPGALSMLTLQAVSASPAALVDWNNNFRDDPDKTILFHCSNFPTHFFKQEEQMPRLEQHPVLQDVLGSECVFGSLAGNISSGDFSFLRLSSNDTKGVLSGYTGQGRILSETIETFGGRGIAKIEGLEDLLKFICKKGFEHHVAICKGRYAKVISHSLENYLGWPVHLHQ